MNKFKIKSDRITAYLLDLLLVAILVTLLISNSITNPFYNKSRESQIQFNETYNREIVNYDLNNNKEVVSFIKAIAPSYRTNFIRKNFASSLWYVVLTCFYFGIFAWFNDGQTLGKKFLRLKVVNNEDGKTPKLSQMIIRNLFGGSFLLLGNNIAILSYVFVPLIKNSFVFMVVTSVIQLLSIALDIVFILLFAVKKNGRTLDDLIGRTKVISIPKKNVSNNQ